MSSLKQILFNFVFALALALPGTVTAQDNANVIAQRSAMTITASASADRIRIAAPSSIAQMHVEVYAASGEKLLDNEIRGGNVFDWHLQDGQGQHLSVGDYVCVVTVKNIAGRITQKIGAVRMGEKDVSVQPAAQLSSQQSQAIGPVEENSSWTVLKENENQTTTVIAHDGTDGQIVRGRGALSFRLGDFFSGNDQEQMRLTEEGNLGIGTAKPEAKLDVAGAVRARQGFVFNDGSTLNVNEKGALILTGSDGTVAPNAAGTGTQNHLAKWLETGGAGTLGDSSVTELANGFVGIGTTNPQVRLDVVDYTSSVGGFQLTNHTNGSTAQLQNRLVNNAGAFAYYGMTSSGYTQAPILSNRAFFGSFQADTVIWTQTANDILFATNGLSAATERMRIKASGNVGIGTNNPQSLLHLTGNAGTFTPFRGLTIDQSINPNSNLSGYALSVTTTSSCGPICSVTGTDFLVSSNGNVGVGTASPGTILDVRGNLTLDAGASPSLYTSSSSGEQNRYLQLINSPNSPSASGLKAGGLLVSDSYGFANPGKNDLIVKGNVGIGTATPNIAKLQVNDSSVGTAVYGNSTIATGVFGQSSVPLFG